MDKYQATIEWEQSAGSFVDGKYSRKHNWHFDGGLEVPASASPLAVPEPYTNPAAVDPEEAFVASISSCHMLWFLAMAARKGYEVKKYVDKAEGIMQKNQEGKLAITEVILRPIATFKKNSDPDQQMFDQLHRMAHKRCYIAHSVKAEITIAGEQNVA